MGTFEKYVRIEREDIIALVEKEYNIKLNTVHLSDKGIRGYHHVEE